MSDFNCKICDFKSSQESELEQHIFDRHSDLFIVKIDLTPSTVRRLADIVQQIEAPKSEE
jgi:hypothetical protein